MGRTSIGFTSDAVSDERESALRLSRRLGTRHQEIEFTPDDFWRLLPRMCASMHDLIADCAALPTLKLAEFAKREVKVILSGEGGDEGFAGYRRYRVHRRGLLRTWLRGTGLRKSGNTARLGHVFRAASVAAWTDGPDQDRFDTTGFTRLQTFQARDISDWLPDNLMTKVDRCLMAHGIAGRVPLLDRELLGFPFSLRDQLKLAGDHHEYPLRRWVADHQPKQEPWANKRGFTVPIADWLETRRPRILSYLNPHPAIQPIVVAERLKDWLEKPLDGPAAKLLFNLLCYALWHDTHIRSVPVPAEVLEPSKVETLG